MFYEVYNEYSGLNEYNELPSCLLLAGRYIILDSQYNDDGVFGSVMCAYDLIDNVYVAIKRQKSAEAFS